MGFLNKMFGGGKDYPELDASSPVAQRLNQIQGPLKSLTQEVNDNLEVVPVGQRAFVFIGKPPKRFGLAWVEGSEVKNLKNLADDFGVAPDRMTRIVNQIREAYEHSAGDPRYRAQVAGQEVVVAASERLQQEVEEIIHSAEK